MLKSSLEVQSLILFRGSELQVSEDSGGPTFRRSLYLSSCLGCVRDMTCLLRFEMSENDIVPAETATFVGILGRGATPGSGMADDEAAA